MKTVIYLSVIIFLQSLFISCGNSPKTPYDNIENKSIKQGISPTICLYTLGNVDNKLRNAIIDSLQNHYPKCKFVKNLPLPKTAITKKRNDHTRYISDSLNLYLNQFSSDSTIIIGLTSADIGKDNFRNRPHSGIMGEAKGIGIPVAVFSSYRPRNNTQLFSVMLHEIGHTQGLKHCPDSKCMMQNANGGNPFARVNSFCAKCKKHMVSRGWKL